MARKRGVGTPHYSLETLTHVRSLQFALHPDAELDEPATEQDDG